MQANKYFFHFIFVIFVFLFSFGAGKEVLAAISPDGCVSWDTYCVNSSITADLSWNALTQADINEIRSDCTLQSVNYTVNIIGLGTRNAGAATSYTWTGLAENTTYQWRVRADYQCTIAWRSGLIWTDTYSFTTTVCNQPPSAINLSMTEADYCGAPYPPIILSWQFSDPNPGDTQSAYQVQVDNQFWFPSPEKDSGKVISSHNGYAPIGLSFNTTYYWRVRVWDNQDTVSAWSVGPSFTTDLHPYPDPDFSWSPQYPIANELIQFTDQTAFYNSPGTWFWNFGDGNTTTTQNPTHSYDEYLEYTVTLEVTDGTGYTCSISKALNVELPLPEWKEIPPF